MLASSCASSSTASTADARLGLTATAPHDGTAAQRLVELVGRTAYELTIGDLAGRFLSSFDAVALHLDLTVAERRTYDRWMIAFRTVYARFRRVTPAGFWTREYVELKLARLRAADLPNLVLCVDESRNCADAAAPPSSRLVRFHRWIDVASVLRVIE